jgi:hypothetical protein
MDREGHDGVNYFVGTEVERTPAYGLKTLFVVGVQPFDSILAKYKANNCQHIFFGANHSYNPQTADEFEAWEQMLVPLLKKDVICSLDIPSNINLEWFLEGGMVEYDNFIPQIRVSIPYVSQWGYNAMVKVDDIDFNESNPGVWCHSLHNLMDREKFTPWSAYTQDKVV